MTTPQPGQRWRSKRNRGFTYILLHRFYAWLSNEPKWEVRFASGNIGRVSEAYLLKTCKERVRGK